jgi:hypothetical protein
LISFLKPKERKSEQDVEGRMKNKRERNEQQRMGFIVMIVRRMQLKKEKKKKDGAPEKCVVS